MSSVKFKIYCSFSYTIKTPPITRAESKCFLSYGITLGNDYRLNGIENRFILKSELNALIGVARLYRDHTLNGFHRLSYSRFTVRAHHSLNNERCLIRLASRLFLFKDIKTIMELAPKLHSIYKEENSLYKDSSGQVKPTFYVYGVATSPMHRKKGYASMLLSQLKARAVEQGICALYLTAEESAWNCYERFGFNRNARLSRTDFAPRKCSEIRWRQCAFDKFSRLHGEYLDSLNDEFFWSGSELKFMYHDIRRDGEILTTAYGGREYYAAVRLRDDELIIIETNFPREHGNLLAGSIATHFDSHDTVSIFGPEDKFFGGDGVIKTENFYIGHTLFIDGGISPESVYMNLLAD